MYGLYKMTSSQKGFTLVEIAIVLLISGFTMMVAANFVKQYTIDTQYIKTIENIEMVQTALREYVGLNGVYPCPADPTLGPNDANYGVSQCRDYISGAFDPDNCTNVPLNITCTTVSSRDGDSNGAQDVVMIGVIPFKTLADRVVSTPFREHHRLDGYGMLFSYAVTEHMTNTNIYNISNPTNPKTGAIRVEDENQRSVTIPDASAHFIAFSHGENKLGGYSVSGDRSGNCMVALGGAPPALPTPGPITGAGIKLELENCDNNDAIFEQGIRSLGDNDNYNDDILVYVATGINALWKRQISSPVGESYIYNTNLGNVGIGTDNPSDKLHVMGSIEAEEMAIARGFLNSGGEMDYFCNQTGADCVDPDFIGGDLVPPCPSGQVAYAIGDNQIECRSVTWSWNTNKQCGPLVSNGNTSFLRGFSNAGNIFCCDTGNVCEVQ